MVHVCLRGFPVGSHEILNLGDFRLMGYSTREQWVTLLGGSRISLSGTNDDVNFVCVNED